MSAIRATHDTVSLRNEAAELTLVGSLLIDGDVFAAYCDQIDPEWLSDDMARLYFRAGLKVHERGGKVGPVPVIAELPDGGQISRADLGRLYMQLTDAAVAADQVPAIINVVRDRWARRTLHGIGSIMAKEADRFEADPFVMAAEISADIDRLHASRVTSDNEMLAESSRKLIEAIRNREDTAGCTTGLARLDDMLNGYKPGQLYVIAARPAMGKSAFAVSSLLRTALAGHGVAFFSLEMTAAEVSARAHADLMDNTTLPTFGTIMRGKINDEYLDRLTEAHQRLEGLPIWFDYSPSLTVKEIAARARRLRQEWAQKGQKLDVVCVDHLTEISPSQRYSGNPVMEVSENIKALRVLAKELDCCVVALCQLSREVEKRNDKKPQLSDLRWTGEIEQAAHVVAFLYREYYYAKDNPDFDQWNLLELSSRMDFLVRKNRQGETGDVRLWCSMPHSSVRDAR